MPNKFKNDDVVVAKGTTTPVMTVVEVIERENKLDSKFLRTACYKCNSLEGECEYEEDEIELYANIE